ncbi:unnamed protein product, partial [Rotaria sordida]
AKIDTYVGIQLRQAFKLSIVNAHLEWHSLLSLVTQSPKIISPLHANDCSLVHALFDCNELYQ